jgi:hypothetical protein
MAAPRRSLGLLFVALAAVFVALAVMQARRADHRRRRQRCAVAGDLAFRSLR